MRIVDHTHNDETVARAGHQRSASRQAGFSWRQVSPAPPENLIQRGSILVFFGENRGSDGSGAGDDAMSLIDWADPEEMLGLLLEYVADETVASHDDADRDHFLNQLARELGDIAEQVFESVDRIALALREIHDSQPREFASDPVMAHVEACIEELHRIGMVNGRGSSAR